MNFTSEILPSSTSSTPRTAEATSCVRKVSASATKPRHSPSRMQDSMNHFFSRQCIIALESTIREKLRKFVDKTRRYTKDGQVLNLQNAWSAFVGDVITQYCFAFDYDHLNSEGFTTNWHKTFHSVIQIGHLSVQFPIILAMLNSLPEMLVERLDQNFAQLIGLHRGMRREVTTLRAAEVVADNKRDGSEKSVISSILRDENLSAREKETQRIVDDGVLLISAGVLTTAWAMSVASFHIINNKSIYETLRAELDTAIPDPTRADAFKWADLERLPYLSGCIRESIRLSQPFAHRSQRLCDHPVQYRKWVIPPRTPVGMNVCDVCRDEKIFPDHTTFSPERWINNEQTKYGDLRVDKFFVVFGRGSRSCLGMNLAWGELYLGMAAMFRNFKFELHETDITDAQVAHDFALPSPKLDTRGVRVRALN